MDGGHTEGLDAPRIRKALPMGAALLAVGVLFAWAGLDPLLDGDLSRADLLGLVAVGCGVVVFLGGLMIVAGIGYHMHELRQEKQRRSSDN